MKMQYCTDFNKASSHLNLTIKESHKMMNWQYIIIFSYSSIKNFQEAKIFIFLDIINNNSNFITVL